VELCSVVVGGEVLLCCDVLLSVVVL
jgi:hypothetical protein